MSLILQGKFSDAIEHLTQNSSLNVNFHMTYLRHPGLVEINPLYMAAYFGEINLVLHLLKRGAKLDALSNGGKTALHAAVVGTRITENNGREKVINTLIYFKRELLTIADSFGNMPIHLAALQGCSSSVKRLLDYDNDLKYTKNTKTQKSALEQVQEKIKENESIAPTYEATLSLLNNRIPSLYFLCTQFIAQKHADFPEPTTSLLPQYVRQNVHLHKPLLTKMVYDLQDDTEEMSLEEKLAALKL